jgi:hypothetical protein
MAGLFSKPKVQEMPTPTEVKVPIVNQEIVDRSTADIMRRRRGAAATDTGASGTGSTAGSVAAQQLLGS